MSEARNSASAGAVSTAKPSNWNVPNVLTVLRIIAVPFFIVALVAGGTFGAADPTHRWLAWIIFILAMLTDWADGYLARSRNLITSFGKIADPIADKFLTGAAFIVLSALGELWWWVTMAASKGGKIKTVLQTVALVLMLLPLGQLGLGWLIPGWVLMGAVTAITVWTGLVYVRDAYILRRNWLQAQASQGGGH